MSPKDDVIELEGTVEESLPSASFRVSLDSGQLVLGHLSGKMRMNYIKILPGDRVLIEMSVYDLSKGRITRRLPIQRNTPAQAEVTAPTPDPTVSTEGNDTHLNDNSIKVEENEG